jgi:hypothetical protein
MAAAVSEEYLEAQRERILARIAAPAERRWRHSISPALAAAAMILLGVMLLQPQPAELALAKESHLYTEIYEQVMDSVEPRAAAPIRGMFEE